MTLPYCPYMIMRFHSFGSFPLHVVGKCPYSVWPTLTPDKAWEIFSKTIDRLQREYSLRTHAFVMMSNHYHWLCIYDDVKQDIKPFECFHEALSSEFDPCSDCFEAPAKIEVIDHFEAYRNTYRYIYRNPVAAGLVASAENYPYSTLPFVLGEQTPRFLCLDNMNLICNPRRILDFINQST